MPLALPSAWIDQSEENFFPKKTFFVATSPVAAQHAAIKFRRYRASTWGKKNVFIFAQRRSGPKPEEKGNHMITGSISGPVANSTLTGEELEGKELEMQGVQAVQNSVSFGSVVANLFALLALPGRAVIDFYSRKIAVQNDGEGVYAAAEGADDSFDCVVVGPEAGQTGKSLTWLVDAGSPSGPLKDAIDDLVAPAKPTFTLAGLINAIARVAPEGSRYGMTIDQAQKMVKVFPMTSGQQATFVATLATPQTADDYALIELTDTRVAPTGNNSLPFEGGEI